MDVEEKSAPGVGVKPLPSGGDFGMFGAPVRAVEAASAAANEEANAAQGEAAAALGAGAVPPLLLLAGDAPDAHAAPDATTAPTAGAGETGFVGLIASATAIKLVVDTAVQVFNPFLSLIAAGLGSSVIVLGRLISLRALMGIFAPFFGSLTGRWGYRRTIRLTLLLTGTGILIVGLSPNVWTAAPGMMIMGLGTGSFVALLHAYLSGRLPYSRRAQGLGIVEYSWALTGIVGLLLVGLLIEATNWRVPMILIGMLLYGAALLVMRLPPTTPPGAALPAPATPAPVAAAPVAGAPALPFGARVAAYFRLPGNIVSTWATIAAGALNYFAALQVMIIYGTWLSDTWGLGPAALGRVAFVFGWFDLTASVGVSLFADRLGKRPAMMLGALVAVVGYFAAAFLRLPMVGAIALIGVARLGFEFAIVSYFPLVSEQQPTQRSKIMTLGSAISLTFATAAGFTAPWLYTAFGMGGVVLVSGVSTALAVLVLLLLVKEGGAHPSSDPAH